MQGRPLEVRITPGQQHESTVAEDLLDYIHGDHCLADGGYDADHIIEALKTRGKVAVIPPSASRNKKRRYDKRLYRERFRVEVFFHNLKRFRRIATRYEKTIAGFSGFVFLGCALLWIA